MEHATKLQILYSMTVAEKISDLEDKKLTNDQRLRNRRIVFDIESSENYCGVNCPGMGLFNNQCNIFNNKLDWDQAKSTNRCLRLHECKIAERRAIEHNQKQNKCSQNGCGKKPKFTVHWVSKNMETIFIFSCHEHLIEILQNQKKNVMGSFQLEF